MTDISPLVIGSPDTGLYKRQLQPLSIFDRSLIVPAIGASFRKLDPRALVKNPVMFCVEIVSVLTTIFFFARPDRRQRHGSRNQRGFSRGRSHFGCGSPCSSPILPKRWPKDGARLKPTPCAGPEPRPRQSACQAIERAHGELVDANALKPGDLVLVEAGELIPSDGEVIEGVASVDESAITGESAPVIRESGGDRSAVTGGTRVTSDWLKVRITAAQGSTFLDRMIALVEGAVRQKTPNEIALNILLAGMTLIFVFATVTIPSFASYAGGAVSVVVLVALFVTLIPTTIGALLSAIGIAGMDRLVRFNVLAMSGRAVEAAGDVDTLLLDKTGTITLGNRQATEFIALPGVEEAELADMAQLASLSDETPEGRSIVVLAKEKFALRAREMTPLNARFVPFSAQTRMSGIDVEGMAIRKGAVDAIIAFAEGGSTGPVWRNVAADAQAALRAAPVSDAVRHIIAIAERIAREGGTPLAVAKDERLLGIVHLKDIVKGGIRDRFAELRRMGIRTVMITGDNPLTAAAIAAESGVDDFLAQATPENKLQADPRRAGQRQARRDVRRRHQ